MKVLLFALLCCASLGAQSLTFLVDNTGGDAPSSELPALTSPYQFPDTPVGSSSSIVIRVVNSSEAPVTIGAIYVGASAGTATPNQNFTITGLAHGAILAPQGSCKSATSDTGCWTPFVLNFTPSGLSPPPGYLRALAVNPDGSSKTIPVATLQGTGTPAQLTLTCSGPPAQCNGTTLQPNSLTPFNFGILASGSVSSVTFTLTNQSSIAVNTPSVSLQTQGYLTSAFSIDTSALPGTIGPALSASFTLTFAPVQPSAFLQAALLVGSSTYQVQGTPTGGLQISYVDSTGIRYTPASNSIAFGQVNGAATLAFTVTNPIAATSAALVSVSVSGDGFLLSGAPATAATLQAGQSMPTFQLTFSGSQPGSNSGTLTIGTQVFALTATVPQPIGAPGSPLSGITLMCGASTCAGPFASNQQVNVSVQLPSLASVESIFTLTMAFAPSVAGVSDDPAIEFIAPLTARTFQMTMSAGSQSATYNGNSQLTFQTGTTAGTITFTVTYLGQPAATLATIVIQPAEVQLVSTLAQRQDQNLVITVNGYDNTYSIGQLSFTFYDTSGRVITSSPIQASVVATDFHAYFFGSNDLGGAFGLQATFPMLTGDVTQVGSVAVTLTNSVGTVSATQPFQ